MKILTTMIAILAMLSPLYALAGNEAESYLRAYAAREDVPKPVHVQSPEVVNAPVGTTVMAAVTINADGVPVKVEVERTEAPEFADEVAVAVKQWRFAPFVKDGEAVSVRVMVPFRVAEPVAEVVAMR